MANTRRAQTVHASLVAAKYVLDAVKAEAMGYLLKDVPVPELMDTIRRVHAGKSFIQPRVASKLLLEFGRRSRTPAEEELTKREREVLSLLAAGASNREIGAPVEKPIGS